MKTFNYEIDISKLTLAERETLEASKLTQKGVFELYFNQALNLQSQGRGIKAAEGRAFVRICNKLDLASGPDLELEEFEFELLKSAFLFPEATWQPAQYRIVLQYLSKFES